MLSLAKTVIFYYTQVTIDMKDNLGILEKMVTTSDVPMSRFSGTRDITKKYSKKDKEKLKKILDIYKSISKTLE